MTPYGNFASVYDELMADTDYDGWVNYITAIFAKFGKKPDLVLDLGCGTGAVTRRLAAKGFDMIGIDNSPDMLAIAKSKDQNTLYLNQDIRAFELYGTVDAAVALCDVINYVLTVKSLEKVFNLTANYLNPGGLFIFDILTPYKYKKILGSQVFTRHTKDISLIWDNRYYQKQRLNEYRLTFFARQGKDFRRFFERHLQRAHDPNQLKSLLISAGFKVFGPFDEKTFKTPAKNAQRVFFVAKKQ